MHYMRQWPAYRYDMVRFGLFDLFAPDELIGYASTEGIVERLLVQAS